MTRIVILFSIFLLLAAGAAWLAGNPGSVTINFISWQLTTSFALLSTALGCICLISGCCVWVIGMIRRELPVIGTNRQLKRQNKGFEYLNKSLVALSSGDHKLAARLVKQSELLLPPQPMLHLIAAEAALKRGYHAEASERFELLKESEDGRLIGLRGLVSEARRTGQSDEALRLARQAFEENRKSPWVLKTLFSLEVAAGHWTTARTALNKVIKEKLIDQEQAARHQGALLFAEAVEQTLKGDQASARKTYEQSLKVRPWFAPSIAALARIDKKAGQEKKASKRLLEAWSKAPYALLARVYKDLDVAESGEDWLKRVRDLISRNPDHRESHLLLADAFLDARRPAEAAPVITRLLEKFGDRLVWELKLRLASQLGQSTDAAEEALQSAPLLPNWYCGDCGTPVRDWSVLCQNCKEFDTLIEGREGCQARVTSFGSSPLALMPKDRIEV